MCKQASSDALHRQYRLCHLSLHLRSQKLNFRQRGGLGTEGIEHQSSERTNGFRRGVVFSNGECSQFVRMVLEARDDAVDFLHSSVLCLARMMDEDFEFRFDASNPIPQRALGVEIFDIFQERVNSLFNASHVFQWSERCTWTIGYRPFILGAASSARSFLHVFFWSPSCAWYFPGSISFHCCVRL